MPSNTVTQMVMDANTITTIINNINSLYSNAIGQLITYTVGILAFVGVFIPLAIARFQSKQLRADNDALNIRIAAELEDARKALSDQIKLEVANEISLLNAKIDETKKELKENIVNESARLNAKTHHVQGNTYLARNDNIDAFEDYLIALKDYAKAKDEGNIQGILANLDKVLPRLSQGDFENKDRLEIIYNNAVKNIESLNTNGRYVKDLRDLDAALKNAKSRVKTPEALISK